MVSYFILDRYKLAWLDFGERVLRLSPTGRFSSPALIHDVTR